MNAAFFQNNRQAIGAKAGLVVVAANSRMQSSNDAFFPFEQEANFWYLTGIDEPDWLVIIDGTRKSWLVSPEVSSVHEVFDGSLPAATAKKISGADAVILLEDAEPLLRELAKKHSIVHTVGEHPHKAHFNFVENPAGRESWKRLERIFSAVQDCRKDLARLRAIKQPEEIAAMKKAIKQTIGAFEAAKQRLNDGVKSEYELAAEFDFYFGKNNSRHAYAPIVAAGANACTLHYTANNMPLKKRNMVLLDVGARVGGYAADITRTYSNGLPTKRQQELHAGVVAAQKEIIALLGPGFILSEYVEKVDEVMKRFLCEVGLLKSGKDEENYRRYFPHAVSHGLGIDVHDSLGGARVLEPGMVLTVEPGVYVARENIGIRIEDDILITNSGRTNLSVALSTDY